MSTPVGSGDAGEAEKPPSFPVVGIGASAGGLDALETLTRRLSSDGMAYVVLQHLAPDHESLLTEILARCTSLRVVTISDKMALETNTIYVMPPDANVAVEGGLLRLSPPSERIPRHSIDFFFRSLAAERGTAAIGVVLSGAGSDGTLGLKVIKEAGGITFAQEPATASHPSMPESALDAGCADYCLAPAEIGDELMRLSAHPFVARKRPQRLFSEAILAEIFGRLLRAFGVNFAAYKLATIERRIERRMALQKIERAEDYLKLLEGNFEELNILYGDLLIGVTGFFRDHEPFEALKAVVFPRLLDKRSTDAPIRIWVPGCATGEEVYSIAICLLEYLDGRPAGYRVQIFGTDIDDQALTRARLAVYPQSIEVDVSRERLQRFFSRVDKGYQLSRQVRDLVVFARHNLGKDPPFSRLDLVSCRNVLIYMQPPLQKKVLKIFHYALNPDAFLLLGSSESVGDAANLFSLLERKLKIYLKKNAPSAAVFDFVSGARVGDAERPSTTPPPASTERRPTVSLQQLADRKVLEKFGPPGVLIDDRMEVVQFRGQTGPYLGPSPGAATLNVLKLVRPELLVELRLGIQRVLAEGLPLTSAPISLWGGRADTAIILEVLPVQEAGGRDRCVLILFRETSLAAAVEQAELAKEEEKRREPRAQELERELLVTKEYLQTTVQDLEASNEELQSANEELQSANEELQSTNEELETSKEELQSTNEELNTVNEELQNRMTQLSVSNDDLQNMLSDISAPVVIVGMDLRIRRFSVAAERLLNLSANDVGRPVAYLEASINAQQIESMVSETINTVRERGHRVRCPDGQWYTMRSIPYRTADHAIRGAVIELLRAPPARRLGEPVEIDELVGRVLSTLPHVLMLLDDQLRILWVNKAFFETFSVGAEVLGRSLDEVWLGRSIEPALWSAFEECAASGRDFGDLIIKHPFGRASDRPMRFSARCIQSEGDRPPLTLILMEEIEGVAGGGAQP